MDNFNNELLEKAKITDGKLNVDEVMEAAKKEFPKHAVPKNVFNDKCEELKTANATITTLKKENGDNEELQNKIKDYETEIGNKIYYSEKGEKGNLDIFSKNKLLNEWSDGRPLPGSINASGNANYPFVLSDGVTVYYASDGEGLGGYDIFVTRYNTNTDTYLVPENVGMPFNSPYNDYMYVIDEYNNLGWFASDRFQPEGKVCIYVFIPNTSKQTYNYEAMEQQEIIRLAQIHSLKETWTDKQAVTEALQRLKAAISHKPKERRAMDFEFVIDDNTTYYLMSDFKSAKAKTLFQRYQQMEKDYYQQEEKLNSLRQQYAGANQQGKAKMAPAILDLEKRILQMSEELDALEVNVRNAEKTK